MRAAPPLALNLGPGQRERTGLAGLAALSAACAAGWALWHLALLTAWPAAALAAVAAAWLAARAWRPAVGTLAWDGRGWAWTPAAEPLPCQVRPVLGAGPWLLLALRPSAGGRRWAGVWRSQVGAAAWHALHAIFHAGAGGQGATA